MIPAEISGATRVLGAPKNWNRHKDGPCAGLPIRDAVLEGTTRPCMVSAWRPTPDELERLNAGAAVELCVIGIVHPPVSMTVGPSPAPARTVAPLDIPTTGMDCGEDLP